MAPDGGAGQAPDLGEFIARQAPDGQLALLRSAARRQDVETLRLLTGVLKVREYFRSDRDPFELEGGLAFYDHPTISSLAGAACHGKNEWGKRNDPVSGKKILGPYHCMRRELIQENPEFIKFFDEQVQHFIDGFRYEALNIEKADLLESGLKRYRGALSVLLATCLSFKDPQMLKPARDICSELSRVCGPGGTPVSLPFDSAVASELFVSEVLMDRTVGHAKHMLHPAVVAIDSGNREGLDLLTQFGWRPGQVACYRRKMESDHISAVFSPSVADPMGLYETIRAAQLAPLPSIMDRILERTNEEIARVPASQGRALQDSMIEWIDGMFNDVELDGGELNRDAVCSALAAGVFERFPGRAMHMACRHALDEVMESLRELYPWAQAGGEHNPLSHILNNPRRSRGDNDLDAKIQSLFERVVQWCDHHGAGHLLREPIDLGHPLNGGGKAQTMPLIQAIRLDCPSAVVLCLEHGADPLIPDELGDTALSLAQSMPGSAAQGVLRSWMARDEANRAIDELRAQLGSTGAAP